MILKYSFALHARYQISLPSESSSSLSSKIAQYALYV